MFPFMKSDRGITIHVDGRPRLFSVTHPNYKALSDAIEAGDENLIRELSDVRVNVKTRTAGRVEILDNSIKLNGYVITGRLVERILEMVALGSKAVDGYIAFLDNLYDNPSKTAIDELFLWVEACDCPITSDGHFLAYRYVNYDYMDNYSHTVFQKPAVNMTFSERDTYSKPVICGAKNEVTVQVIDNITTVSTPRNMVDDIRDNHCSNGLHFCSFDYLPKYNGDNNKPILVVKINPAEVVSIPSDYNNAKGRTCKYQVVGELESNITLTPWFTDEYDDAGMSDDSTSTDDNVVKQRLSPNQVRDMKNNYLTNLKRDGGEYTYTSIAKLFDVHRETVARIDRGELWTHIS